jgi:hypothetical protein
MAMKVLAHRLPERGVGNSFAERGLTAGGALAEAVDEGGSGGLSRCLNA